MGFAFFFNEFFSLLAIFLSISPSLFSNREADFVKTLHGCYFNCLIGGCRHEDYRRIGH